MGAIITISKAVLLLIFCIGIAIGVFIAKTVLDWKEIIYG